jgi:hypothetical protein
MKPPKRYTLADIQELIDLLRNDKKLSQEKIDGMDFLVKSFEAFENINDMSEDKKSAICRGVNRWWDREKAIEKMSAQVAKEARKKKRLEKTGKYDASTKQQ